MSDPEGSVTPTAGVEAILGRINNSSVAFVASIFFALHMACQPYDNRPWCGRGVTKRSRRELPERILRGGRECCWAGKGSDLASKHGEASTFDATEVCELRCRMRSLRIGSLNHWATRG